MLDGTRQNLCPDDGCLRSSRVIPQRHLDHRNIQLPRLWQRHCNGFGGNISKRTRSSGEHLFLFISLKVVAHGGRVVEAGSVLVFRGTLRLLDVPEPTNPIPTVMRGKHQVLHLLRSIRQCLVSISIGYNNPHRLWLHPCRVTICLLQMIRQSA
jgi:hypothetical protein